MRAAIGTDRSIAGNITDGPRQALRYIGIDAGAENIKVVEVSRTAEILEVTRREVIEHGKKPGVALVELLGRWDWSSAAGAAITGRFAKQVRLPRIPGKQAQIRGFRFLGGEGPATVVNIGSHGFSVLEMRSSELAVFRENSRCSQGTGNFLRQLVERFSLTVEEAGKMCAEVENAAPLSGRCPVILKTDMTHLANKGEDRVRILAGLFDAVCENILILIRPGVTPARVLLTGGVSRSPRVRCVFARKLSELGMELMKLGEEEALCLEALGAALVAAEKPSHLPALEHLLLPRQELKLERLAALTDSLPRVRRIPSPGLAPINGSPHNIVLGLDIGSTGSKLVALDAASGGLVWEAYRQTLGNPVGAAKELVAKFQSEPVGLHPVVAFGATGSGREIAGSLLTSCYGKEAVFIVNEIVAHATGALHYDSRVDTIFEIGGQDAKYIRLAEGRIIDCAMNEACSAGTGSFIEEQGGKFSGIQDVQQLGRAAAAAPWGVSLGQHCSVFMAEVIDEAVSAGVDQSAIISGLYDSIIKNYLNRVKGNRSVGRVIFCQGMPFSADALAAAVARQTGSEVIVPPNPGTVGALGIALLACRELQAAGRSALDLSRFLGATVEQKDNFVCRATTGCGGAGNRCRIERLRTLAGNQRSIFTWGGGCALHDKGTRKRKLPDLAPDPFREREELLHRLIEPFTAARGKPRIALSEEFMLKGLLPFFTRFFHEAGFDLEYVSGANQATLKAGIQSANVPFCAPMQLFHGVAAEMAKTGAQYVFIPMLRSVPRLDKQRCSVVCPIVQASPDLLRGLIEQPPAAAGSGRRKLLAPLLEFGAANLESAEFLRGCEMLGKELGLTKAEWRSAWHEGVTLQRQFDDGCLELGRRALDFCRAKNIVPVVVLGRTYTIYDKVLNSNVPAILREQGVIGIPVDCYPVTDPELLFPEMYWGYAHNLLRAAHQVRRNPGVYALYCSNYSCGPDSFNLHFVAYVMEGKPFAVIETDGHSGDAGTRTRVEAFLHCVDEHRQSSSIGEAVNDLTSLRFSDYRFNEFAGRKGSAKLLVPYMGPSSQVVGAAFRGLGLDCEALPAPDAESLRLGRRYTSGKECLPMPLTLGTLIQRLEKVQPGERLVYVMPSASGPCRFGIYNLLNKIVLERLGWNDRLKIWSPKDSGYFDQLPAGTEMLVLAGVLATDFLQQAQMDVRPLESHPGGADALYERFLAELLLIVERAAAHDMGIAPSLAQVLGGKLFGIAELLERAGIEFAALRAPGDLPLVELTGEIYVRGVPFSNDYIAQKLEGCGLRVRMSPQAEWLAYCGYRRREKSGGFIANRISDHLQHRIEAMALAAIAPHMGWAERPNVPETLKASRGYVSECLDGEAVLTVGGAVHEWRHKHIDAVVCVGPLECMPTKIAEAQFHHVAEREGLLTLTLAFNGDPISLSVLDSFAFEVKERYAKKRGWRSHEDLKRHAPSSLRPSVLTRT
jgi:activator of 2-hydroxyglutaryl-CoA dehydratase/predicted nucleotide-binding protein (sugar kinase/HSP70/actin superfamily)